MTVTPKHPLEIPSRTGSNHPYMQLITYTNNIMTPCATCKQGPPDTMHSCMHTQKLWVREYLIHCTRTTENVCMMGYIASPIQIYIVRIGILAIQCYMHTTLRKAGNGHMPHWKAGRVGLGTRLLCWSKCLSAHGHLPGNYYPESVDSMSSRDACIIICYCSTTYVY